MKRFSFAIALLSAPLFASSTTSFDTSQYTTQLYMTGSEFQAENHGPRASWLVFSDSQGTVLTTTRVPGGSELIAEVPASLLHEVRVEVLTPTSQGIYRGERTLLSLLPPDPTPETGDVSALNDPTQSGSTTYAAHGGGSGVDDGATPPVDNPPPTPPL